jgi:hypothetical protein
MWNDQSEIELPRNKFLAKRVSAFCPEFARALRGSAGRFLQSKLYGWWLG